MRILLTEAEFRDSAQLLSAISLEASKMAPTESQRLLRESFQAYQAGDLYLDDLLDQLPINPHFEIYAEDYDGPDYERDVCIVIYDDSFQAVVNSLTLSAPTIVSALGNLCLGLRVLGVNLIQATESVKAQLRQVLTSSRGEPGNP